MSQMNVSVTKHIAAYVRKKVRSGRYNNASEVVREALRRMEEEEARALRLAKPTADDLLTDLTQREIDRIRRKVREGILLVKRGPGEVYDGRDGLKDFADRVKAGAQKRLALRFRKRASQ